MNLQDTVDVLARTAWGEARNQGAQGMQAVMNVVMNRVASGVTWWGRDIIGVCLAKAQFDCWSSGDPNLVKLQDVDATDPVFQTALELAADAVAGALPDLINGATSYKRTDLPWPAAWGPPVDPLATIGAHSFYVLA